MSDPAARRDPRDGMPGLAPPRPLPLKDRSSIIFIEYGQIDVIDGAFVVIDANGVRTQIPVGGFVCLMLEPGTRLSHAAAALAARAGTLIVFVGEAGVRLYSTGQPGGARADRLLYQARLALDDELRLNVVRKMFEMRFKESAPDRRSVEQLRGVEGARVKRIYELLAHQHGVNWRRRDYDPSNWDVSDVPNRCVSAATACLHGLAEAAVLAAGYAPAIGFLHTGKPLSFVYDVADLFKFETVVPVAFEIAGKAAKGRLHDEPTRAVRRACRDSFRRANLLERLIPAIEEALAAGGIDKPAPPEDAVGPAFTDGEQSGDAGHRG
ncbi:type I-E CRISPR-associated endonuclease Cas1e [Methylocystis echinoides]|uniref:CRISPR-associated endonuclease Cas1 n=1 Tax=Methylocystis echinoides TaxID=29468 RepID=A0A9W6GUS6_9HYPH|nr:type I-E CRISPR-associated endonuclease Cas1e [Methylocystis echinoides]GLI93431.1 CRISPR-associated endonuclease Cas1 [Methylocystis echinoides]